MRSVSVAFKPTPTKSNVLDILWVGRTPWSAADPQIGLFAEERDQGIARGPGGPPYFVRMAFDWVHWISFKIACAITSSSLTMWMISEMWPWPGTYNKSTVSKDFLSAAANSRACKGSAR